MPTGFGPVGRAKGSKNSGTNKAGGARKGAGRKSKEEKEIRFQNFYTMTTFGLHCRTELI